ncbi:MAG: pyrroline-5-carboxylate reductase [Chitinophagaceae bacterium]|nr:MAG: pyrroline-5-carboxylate reductase [Chitinophagaceae bacterium]
MGKKIAIIGGGNLGAAIAEGLVDTGFSEASDITVTKRNISTLKGLQQKGVITGTDNSEAVRGADVVVLAVKPFQVAEVLAGIKNEVIQGKLLISVVTGVLISEMDGILQSPIPLFRAMPNTAIAIGESMTCICSRNASAEDVSFVNDLFSRLGKVVTIDEKLMEAATILAACGTAYALRYIRANIQGGIEIGFDAATASLIAAQTVKGAADLLLRKGTHPEQEIDKVTTPKGCTIAGLNEMEHQGFSSSLIRGVVTSYRKIARD